MACSYRDIIRRTCYRGILGGRTLSIETHYTEVSVHSTCGTGRTLLLLWRFHYSIVTVLFQCFSTTEGRTTERVPERETRERDSFCSMVQHSPGYLSCSIVPWPRYDYRSLLDSGWWSVSGHSVELSVKREPGRNSTGSVV